MVESSYIFLTVSSKASSIRFAGNLPPMERHGSTGYASSCLYIVMAPSQTTFLSVGFTLLPYLRIDVGISPTWTLSSVTPDNSPLLLARRLMAGDRDV